MLMVDAVSTECADPSPSQVSWLGESEASRSECTLWDLRLCQPLVGVSSCVKLSFGEGKDSNLNSQLLQTCQV